MKKGITSNAASPSPLRPQDHPEAVPDSAEAHIYNKDVRCVTDSRGYETHRNRSPLEIRVDATDGFIPLWAQGVRLRYRFQERSFQQYFADPQAAKTEIIRLFGAALEEWGDAAPVSFTYDENASDFEFVMLRSADCNSNGCVLASAFFPDGGRHELQMYPTMFEQSTEEQIETFIHETGHIFGLRHFFANISETTWPSRLFGTDSPFSIMNYGARSTLTEADRFDLTRLYQAAWSGELTEIDGAPIRLMQPYNSFTEDLRPKLLAANNLQNLRYGTTADSIQIVVGGRRLIIE